VALLQEIQSSTPKPSDIDATKEATRRELLRRVSIGRDFLISMSDRTITVEDAARAACVSTFHFHRLFQQLFQVSPHIFLRNFRLDRAAHLLGTTDVPVFEIAHRVGFLSAASFTTAFAKKFGFAPQAYRLIASRSK
jgi:transcriptional regulator GlxA family with amidase domain